MAPYGHHRIKAKYKIKARIDIKHKKYRNCHSTEHFLTVSEQSPEVLKQRKEIQ